MRQVVEVEMALGTLSSGEDRVGKKMFKNTGLKELGCVVDLGVSWCGSGVSDGNL